MNSEVVVFSLSAKKIPSVKKFTNLVAEDCDLGGSIVIIKLSDVDFLFQYESDCRSNVLVSVLDNIVLQKDSNRFRVLDGDNPAIFSIDEYSDYLLFEEAVLECRMLSEMVLRLGAVVRDLYYAGIYSSAAADVDDFNLCDEILSLGRKEDNSAELKLFDLTFDEHDMTRKNIKDDIEGDQKQASSGSIGAKDLITNIDCVFCGAQKTMDTAKKFAIHPYVPITFEKKPVYMCLLCLDNWKEYREKAVLDDQLVLEGESNEELCGKLAHSLSSIHVL